TPSSSATAGSFCSCPSSTSRRRSRRWRALPSPLALPSPITDETAKAVTKLTHSGGATRIPPHVTTVAACLGAGDRAGRRRILPLCRRRGRHTIVGLCRGHGRLSQLAVQRRV